MNITITAATPGITTKSARHRRDDDQGNVCKSTTTDVARTFERLQASDAEVVQEPIDSRMGSAIVRFAILQAT